MATNRSGLIVVLVGVIAALAVAYGLSAREATLRCGTPEAEDRGSPAWTAARWRADLTGPGGFECVYLDVEGRPFARRDIGWPLPSLTGG